MDHARSLSATRRVEEDHGARPFHQFQQLHSCRPSLNHFGTVAYEPLKPAGREETDCVVASELVP
jgi:hypothetical protein